MAIAIGLLKTCLELARSRKTGVLDSITSEARVRIFVEDGVIVFADEGTPGDALRQLLLRENVLTQEQHDAAVEWTAERKRQGKPARFGEVLIELGMLTRQQLHAALAAQVQQKVVRALGWPTATIRFFECYGTLELYARFATAIEPLVPAALRLVDAARIEQLFAQSLDRFPALRTDPVPGGGRTRAETLARIDAFELRPPEREFVMSIDGTRPLREILATTAPIDPTVLVASLLLTECLDLHATALSGSQRRPMVRPTPFRGMAPPPRTSYASRPPSNERPSRPSRPSSVHPPAPEEKEQAKNVAARLRSAQDAKRALDEASSKSIAEEEPTRPVLPPEPTPRDRQNTDKRVLAEQAYQLARGYVRANRLPQALAELKRAVALHPTPEYELWVAWVELRSDAKYDRVLIDAARRAAEKMVAQDPTFGFGYFVLGHIAFREGDHARASELFDRANTLEPAALDDVRDVRLRSTESSTQGEVRSLAPLLTTPRPMPVVQVPLESTLVSTGAPPPPDDVAPQHAAAAPVLPPAPPTLPGLQAASSPPGAPSPSPPPAEAKESAPAPPPVETKRSLPAPEKAAPPPPAEAKKTEPEAKPIGTSPPPAKPLAETMKSATPIEKSAPPPAEASEPAPPAETKKSEPEASPLEKPAAPPTTTSEPAPAEAKTIEKPRASEPAPPAEAKKTEAEGKPVGTSAPPAKPLAETMKSATPIAKAAPPTKTSEPAPAATPSRPVPPRPAPSRPPRPTSKAPSSPPAEAAPAPDPALADPADVESVDDEAPEALSDDDVERLTINQDASQDTARAVSSGPEDVPPPAERSERSSSATTRAVLLGGFAAVAAFLLWSRFDASPAISDPDPVVVPVNAVAGEPDGSDDAAAVTPAIAVEPDAGEPRDGAADDAAATVTTDDDDGGAAGEDDAGKPLHPFAGVLDLPPAADGHRVYVDGKMVGVPPAPIVIGCGQHVIRIGSAGKDREVLVPCGGRLSLPYP